MSGFSFPDDDDIPVDSEGNPLLVKTHYRKLEILLRAILDQAKITNQHLECMTGFESIEEPETGDEPSA